MVFATQAGFTAVRPDGQLVQHLGQSARRYVNVFDAGRDDAFIAVTAPAAPCVADDECSSQSAPAADERIELARLDGTVESGTDVPEGFGVVAGDGIGGVVVLGPDREMYRLVPGARPTHLDMPQPIAVSHGRTVAVSCDADLDCGVTIFDLVTGDHQVVPGVIRRGNYPSLSPDGRYLAQVNISSDALRTLTIAVYDTTTGAAVLDAPNPLNLNTRPQWSPDSQWLVWPDPDGVEAWNPTSGTHTITIDTNQSTAVAAVATTGPRQPAP
jgi:hypothetical protein